MKNKKKIIKIIIVIKKILIKSTTCLYKIRLKEKGEKVKLLIVLTKREFKNKLKREVMEISRHSHLHHKINYKREVIAICRNIYISNNNKIRYNLSNFNKIKK